MTPTRPAVPPGRKSVLVVCPYPERCAPSQRLKYEQYFPAWERAGYDVTVAPFISPQFMRIVYQPGCVLKKVAWTLLGYVRRLLLLARLRRYDVVYVHLWVVPYGPPFVELLYCLFARAVVYDVDDMIHLRITEKVNANWFAYAFKSASRVTCLMKYADHVITCTPALDAFARRFNGRTTDVSSTVDTGVYVPRPRHSNDHTLVLGWSGSHSTSRWLRLLVPVLRDLRQDLDFRLVVIGDPEFSADGLDVTALPWREETEVDDLRRIDVGLYPLPDEPWVYGKSGLKAIQYMALGIPPVATAVGANHRVIEDGVGGLLVSSAAGWKAAILRLAADPGLRDAMGRAARERVERLFSIHANVSTYLAILDGATGRARETGDDPCAASTANSTSRAAGTSRRRPTSPRTC